MQIDWAQVVTHIIGFLIAVWLVRRYAWDKLLKFIEHRRELIAESFSEIERGKEEVEAQKQRYDEEFEKIEDTRRAKIQEAAREAEKLAGDIREEAREEALKMREKAKDDISLELDKANVMLKDRTVEAVITAAEKLLKEKLDRDKHAGLVNDFLNEVRVD
jgi:F-type H+-transporting ATPase subunit b